MRERLWQKGGERGGLRVLGRDFVQAWLKTFDRRWKKQGRRRTQFLEREAVWLTQEITMVEEKDAG